MAHAPKYGAVPGSNCLHCRLCHKQPHMLFNQFCLYLLLLFLFIYLFSLFYYLFLILSLISCFFLYRASQAQFLKLLLLLLLFCLFVKQSCIANHFSKEQFHSKQLKVRVKCWGLAWTDPRALKSQQPLSRRGPPQTLNSEAISGASQQDSQ